MCSRRHFLITTGCTIFAGVTYRTASSQQSLVFPGPACSMFGGGPVGEITAFASSEEAREVVAYICDTVGLPVNFTIVAVRDPAINAYAQILGTERYIVYDEEFMQTIADTQDRNWPGLTVMAHEIGHHLCGHTLDQLGSRPPRELEADHFAGFVVGRLEGELEQAIRVFEGMSETGSATHPPRAERIAAVTAGWRKAASKDNPNEERHNVITHNGLPGGGFARVVVQFVGSRDGRWVEYQHGQQFATFAEGFRAGQSIYMFDASRSIWVRLDYGSAARTATGYWGRGTEQQLPQSWIPLDPLAWR